MCFLKDMTSFSFSYLSPASVTLKEADVMLLLQNTTIYFILVRFLFLCFIVCFFYINVCSILDHDVFSFLFLDDPLILLHQPASCSYPINPHICVLSDLCKNSAVFSMNTTRLKHQTSDSGFLSV